MSLTEILDVNMRILAMCTPRDLCTMRLVSQECCRLAESLERVETVICDNILVEVKKTTRARGGVILSKFIVEFKQFEDIVSRQFTISTRDGHSIMFDFPLAECSQWLFFIVSGDAIGPFYDEYGGLTTVFANGPLPLARALTWLRREELRLHGMRMPNVDGVADVALRYH